MMMININDDDDDDDDDEDDDDEDDDDDDDDDGDDHFCLNNVNIFFGHERRSKRKKAESSPGRNDTFHARRRVDGNSLILPTQKIDQQIPSSVMALNSYKWDYNDIYIYNLSYRNYNPIYHC